MPPVIPKLRIFPGFTRYALISPAPPYDFKSPIIPGDTPVASLDQVFGDFFKTVWTWGQVNTAGPRSNFLAGHRPTTVPATKIPILRNILQPIPKPNPVYQKQVTPSTPTDLSHANIAFTQGMAHDWQHMAGIQRVNSYGYRGDGRTPEQIMAAGGFYPSSTRTDDYYLKGKIYEQFTAYMQRKFQRNLAAEMSPEAFANIVKQAAKSPEAIRIFTQYLSWRALMKNEEMHLGRMVASEVLKGYISTTYRIHKAGDFAKTNGGDYIYFVRVKSAFNVPVLQVKKGEKHDEYGLYDEFELANPGPIPWNDVVGFIQRGDVGRPGVIYFQDEFVQKKPEVFKTAYTALSSVKLFRGT